MIIKSDTFYVNKTRKYLLPVLIDYGETLIQKLDSMFKLAVGIGDAVLPKEMNHHIFILFNIDASNGFSSFIKWIRQQDYFSFDYSYDDIVKGHKHMIVLELPKEHKSTYEHFINNKFSKMYPNNIIRKYFKANDLRFDVLYRDDNQNRIISKDLINFVNKINTEFDCEFEYQKWSAEIEFPLEDNEEIFNYKLITVKNGRTKERKTRSEESGRRTTATTIN